MSHIVLADMFGLISLYESEPRAGRLALLSDMTDLVEDKILRFPREVADELAILARDDDSSKDDRLAAWAAGLGGHLNDFRSDVSYSRPFMAYVQDAGFPEGFQALDNKDPSMVHVGRIACEYQKANMEFVILSTDSSKHPLRPTMKQLCKLAGWTRIKPKACRAKLGF
jgi:hypothetical protein